MCTTDYQFVLQSASRVRRWAKTACKRHAKRRVQGVSKLSVQGASRPLLHVLDGGYAPTKLTRQRLFATEAVPLLNILDGGCQCTRRRLSPTKRTRWNLLICYSSSTAVPLLSILDEGCLLLNVLDGSSAPTKHTRRRLCL